MAKYTVEVEIVHAETLDVDAKDEAEAKDKAKKQAETNYVAGVKKSPTARIKSCNKK